MPTNGQCDSIKLQALKWYHQRNECRKILTDSELQNAAYQSLDSIQQMEIIKLRSAIKNQGEIIDSQRDEVDKASRKAARLKKQRNILVGVSGILGAVLAILLI